MSIIIIFWVRDDQLCTIIRDDGRDVETQVQEYEALHHYLIDSLYGSRASV